MFPPKACRPTYLLKSKFSDFWKTRNLPQQHCCGELSLRFPPLMHEARTVLVESSHFTLIPSSLAFTYKKKKTFPFHSLHWALRMQALQLAALVFHLSIFPFIWEPERESGQARGRGDWKKWSSWGASCVGKEQELAGGWRLQAASPALKCSWNKKIPDVTTSAL